MRKNDLAKELAVSEKLHLSTATKAVDGVIRILKEALIKGEEITLRGFGTITPIVRGERVARHFKTKEFMTVPAHRTAKLRISEELKEAMNNYGEGI